MGQCAGLMCRGCAGGMSSNDLQEEDLGSRGHVGYCAGVAQYLCCRCVACVWVLPGGVQAQHLLSGTVRLDFSQIVSFVAEAVSAKRIPVSCMSMSVPVGFQGLLAMP